MLLRPFRKKAELVAMISRTLRIMKCLAVILLAFCLHVSAKTHSQEITLSLNNANLETVFKEIQKQTNYRFVYTKEQLETSAKVTIKVKNETLEVVLQLCFHDQPLAYTIEDRHIIIQIKEKLNSNNFIKSHLQDITGRVTNEQDEPLAGATISIKGTNTATATNDKGEFTLRNAEPNAVIIISSIGYQTQEVRLQGRTNIIIQLKVSVNSLDETVVIAYGTTTKRLNTGSVSKVTSEEISKQPVTNPLAAMQGRVPGLFVTQGGGMPGSNFTVRLRGQNSIQNGNSPLYIIDGVPFLSDADRLSQRSGINANSPFNSINISDIESIEILKDADATAIYGSRGANGVILITTKKGKQGKTTIDVNVYTGWGRVTRTFDYLNTQQYLKMRREAFANDGITPTISNAPDLFRWDTTRYTNWKKYLIGGTARSTNAQVSYSGGNSNTRFLVSANHYKETTVFPTDMGNNRSAISLSVTHISPSNKFSSVFTASYAVDKSDLSSGDVTQYLNLPPNAPKVYDSTGRLNWSDGGFSFANPLSAILAPYEGIVTRLTGNGLFSYKILNDLTAKMSIGYNDVDFDEKLLSPISSQNPTTNPKGASSFGTNYTNSWIAEPQLEYKRKIGKEVTLTALAGVTWQRSETKATVTDATGFTNDNLLNSISSAVNVFVSNNYNLYKYNAAFGRINVNYANKYLLNLTGRRDGSSRFGPGKQFANFYSIGSGYIFSEEKLIKNKVAFLSYGKLRASYGVTGNDQIGNYQYLDTYTATQYLYQNQPGLRPSRLYNPDYSWEQNRKWQTAIELGFLKNRILLNIDWYCNKSDNQIIQYNLPAQTGNSSILMNFPGVVKNSGWEIFLTTKNISKEKLTWNTSFNLSFNKNQLLEFPGLESSSYANNYIIGKSLNIRRGYQFLGVNPQTGIYQFQDLNNDNLFNSLDYVYIGTTDPKYFGGIDNEIHYYGFQLSFLFQFVKQEGIHPIFNSSSVGGRRNQSTEVLNHWQKSGDQTTYQRYSQSSSGQALQAAAKTPVSSAVLTDASYIRLKNVSLSYSFPEKWIRSIKSEKARLYIQAQNLLTITDYIGSDPESQIITSLPPLKMITAGIQITF